MSKIEAEVLQLRAENSVLKALLSAHAIALPQQASEQVAHYTVTPSKASALPPGAKVKLFRKLFHGRDDVYPVR